jgi:hypothetical protein
MTAIFEELNDRGSATVQAALTRKCEVCRAKPGEDCTNMPINHSPLQLRIVHYARTAR